jgi:hypothetical protein
VSKLQYYDFDIEYVKGKNNVVVDSLSRRHSVFSLAEVSVYWKSTLLVEYSKNTFSCELMEGTNQDERYKVVDDIIYYKERIYLVPESMLKDKILRAVHDAPLANHRGHLKTYRWVRERFSWKGLKEDVIWYVRECMNCQQNKSEMTHPTSFLDMCYGNFFGTWFFTDGFLFLVKELGLLTNPCHWITFLDSIGSYMYILL